MENQTQTGKPIEEAIEAALVSVQLEGFEPSEYCHQLMAEVAAGTKTLDQAKALLLQSI